MTLASLLDYDTSGDLFARYIDYQLLYVAAHLRLADLTWQTPRTVAELSSLVHADSDALHRVMRGLELMGVFARQSNGAYQLKKEYERLLSDHSDSLRNFVIMGQEVYFQACDQLLWSVQTGHAGYKNVWQEGFWAYLSVHPEMQEQFHKDMQRVSRPCLEAALAVADFSSTRHLVDIGGGHGLFLSLFLAAYPQTRGTYFDQPHVAERARVLLAREVETGQCEIIEGSFFSNPLPTGGDVYVLSFVIHDWDDEQALSILRRCQQAMSPTSRLILLETVLSENEPDAQAILSDLEMLMLTGGRERTAEQYRDLLTRAGFQLTEIMPTRSSACVIEAHPV